MARRIKHDAQVVPSLVIRKAGAALKGEGRGGIHVFHEHVEVDHLALSARLLGQGWGLVILVGLERNVRAPGGISHDDERPIAPLDFPAEEFP